MKYNSILIAALLFLCRYNGNIVYAQNRQGNIVIQDTILIGNNGLGVGNCIIPVSSGGYLVAGYLSTGEPGQYSGALVRLNVDKDTLWVRRYRTQGDNRAWSVCETPVGDFMVTGFSNSFADDNQQDVWLYRVSGTGEMLWEKSYGGSGDDLAWDIKPMKDNDYVIAAQTNSKGAGNFDAWLLKVDGQGTVFWDNVYGTAGRERVFSVTVGTKGEIYSTGISTPGPAEGPIDVYTICVDPEKGDLIWEDFLDKGGNDTGHGVIFDKRGGVWVTGYTTSVGSGGQDGFLARYLDGKIAHFYTYGGQDNDRIMNVTHGTGDDLWLVGYSTSFNEKDNFDVWAILTDYDGKTIQHFLLPGPGNDRGVHIVEDGDDLVVVGTYLPHGSAGDSQFLILDLALKNR